MNLFELHDANLGYNGNAVLRSVTLTIASGERVALVGPSGAGKSTLLHTLYQQQKLRTALVPQDGALVKQLSVFHNVYIGQLHRHGSLYNLMNLIRPFAREIARVRAILERVGLDDKIATAVGELSGGQQQRTAVARALFHGGEVLLGDEPVSAVDALQARDVLAAVCSAYPTVVMVMHDVRLALEFATRIIGLKDGRMLMDVPSAGLTPVALEGLYR
ncbi:MAG TPA: ATP-binding cassette domain-containing protein [bacterium]|nr:ATP-binding cassette domain-containing protein [bacterium]